MNSEQLIQGFDEAAEFLAANVAQGRLNERGNYGKEWLLTYLGAPESLHGRLTQSNIDRIQK